MFATLSRDASNVDGEAPRVAPVWLRPVGGGAPAPAVRSGSASGVRVE